MQDTEVSKTYVRPDNSAVLTCPHCGRQKVILVDSSKGPRKELTIKCVCHNIFKTNLEFRKNVRKKTNLKGTYVNHSQKDVSGYLTTRDISLAGLTFTSLNMQDFKVGDELSLEFTLQDEHQTVIKKKAVVRAVRQRAIGCEFESIAGGFGNPLGYYVMHKL